MTNLEFIEHIGFKLGEGANPINDDKYWVRTPDNEITFDDDTSIKDIVFQIAVSAYFTGRQEGYKLCTGVITDLFGKELNRVRDFNTTSDVLQNKGVLGGY